MFRESNVRSVVKMISWRGSGTIATMIIVYVLTGQLKVATIVGVFEAVTKMALYYIHERVWNKVNIGRHTVKPFVIWFTGLPSCGKKALADKVYDILGGKDLKVQRLDGTVVRSILPDTGFSKKERDMHIKRVGLLASMLEKNGIIVVASFISPYKEAREFVKKMCDNFIEVYVDTPLEECEKRDTEGLYEKASRGEIKDLTGVNDPYEAPEHPDVTVRVEGDDTDSPAGRVMAYLEDRI